jgi:hypothetical protein
MPNAILVARAEFGYGAILEIHSELFFLSLRFFLRVTFRD